MPANSRKRRRLLAVAAGILLFLGLGVWFAPWLLVHSPFWSRLVDSATAPYGLHVTTGDVTLSWVKPLAVRSIAIADDAGNSVAEIESLELDRSLWKLLQQSSDLGTVRIVHPRVTVHIRRDGSNVEDIIARMLEQSSSARTTAVVVRIEGGQVALADDTQVDTAHADASPPAVALDRIDARIGIPATTSDATEVVIERCRATSGPSTGALTGTFRWHATDGGAAAWSMDIRTSHMPLAIGTPLLRRWLEDIQLAGRLSSDVTCHFDASKASLQVDVRQAELADLTLAGTQLEAGPIKLRRASLTGQAVLNSKQWTLKQCKLDTNIGFLNVDGQLPVPEPREATNWSVWIAAARQGALQLDGDIDLAQLARAAPGAMRVRADTAIESGGIRFQLTGRADGAGYRFGGRVVSRAITARRGDRRITWNDPLALQIDAHVQNQQWQIDKLVCKADFLQVTGRADATAGSFELQGSLDQMMARLGQFIDLSGIQLAGEISSTSEWRRLDGGEFSVQAKCHLRNFVLATNARSNVPAVGHAPISGHQSPVQRGAQQRITWQEPVLDILLTATGNPQADYLESVRTATLEMTAGGDRLQLKLQAPNAKSNAVEPRPMTLELQGQTESWLARLQYWLPTTIVRGLRSSGKVQLNATAAVRGNQLQIDNARLRFEPFRWMSTQFRGNEPVLEARVQGIWDLRQGVGTLRDATLQTTSLALRGSDLKIGVDDQGSSVQGELSLRAQLEPLWQRWAIQPVPADWRVAGDVQGQVTVNHRAENTKLRWAVNVDRGVVLLKNQRPRHGKGTPPLVTVTKKDAWRQVWDEQHVTLSGSGSYRWHEDTATLDQLRLSASDYFELTATGSIVRPQNECLVDMRGAVAYDLAPLANRIQAYTKIPLVVAGKDRQPFWIRGPIFERSAASPNATAADANGLVPDQLAAQCGLSWQAADFLGIVTGPGRVRATLHDHVLETEPIDLNVSDGKLHLVPHLHLDKDNIVLTIDPGPVLSDVEISPEMCRGWLQYVAPMVADATRADGRFSVQLKQAMIPLGNPDAVAVTGTVVVNQAQVGPGPAAVKAIKVANQVKAVVLTHPARVISPKSAWLMLPEQDVHFRVHAGRVYHDRMSFRTGDVVVLTRGSVGFDQSLNLLATIPIRDDWLHDNQQRALLHGEVLEIPLRGSLSKVRPDMRPLADFSKRLLRKAAGHVIEREVKRGLQQLFGNGS